MLHYYILVDFHKIALKNSQTQRCTMH